MPMNLSISFIVALGVGACTRYGIDGNWFTAIGAGVAIFILTLFIVRRVRERYHWRRMEREATEEYRREPPSRHRQDR
jgi:hypothetical protein